MSDLGDGGLSYAGGTMSAVTSRSTIVIEDGYVRAPQPDEHLVRLVDGRWVCVLGEHASLPCALGLAA
jgi:hypothetical protein